MVNNLNLYESLTSFENDFQIRMKINSVEPSSTYPFHWHEHLELLYFTTGKSIVTSGGERYELSEGDLFIVNTSELHATYTVEAGEHICIHFSPHFFADVEFESYVFKPHIVGDLTVRGYVEKMLAESCEHGDAYDMEIKSAAYALMAHLVRCYKLDKLSQGELLLRRNKLKNMHEILTYIAKNYPKRLSTADLARQFHLTEQYFCHLFKQGTGQTPINYINKYRSQRAAVLLTGTDQSITDIALRVGFENSNYFSRIFKKHMGMTPREYRDGK